MNPSTPNVSQNETQLDQRDKSGLEAISKESLDSVSAAERIKGIIKIDHNSPEAESPDLMRLKSKIVSFSSYDDCYKRGSIPSKSVQVNLDDDSIPDKAIIERRLSKLEEERSNPDLTALNIFIKEASETSVSKKPESGERVEDKKEITDKQQDAEVPADGKKVVEETVGKKPDAEVNADDKKVVEEPVSSQQAPQASVNVEKAEEEKPQVPDVHEDNTKMPENKPGPTNEDAKIAELIDAMRPDQSIPRQFVIVEYIEKFCIDENEDPDVKAIFECHHNAPNLGCFAGRTNQAQRQCVPVTENVISTVLDEINKDKHTEVGQGVTGQTDIEGTNKLTGIQIGYEYHGASTSVTDKNNLFSFCNCPQKELNCAKPSSSRPTSLAQKTVKNNKQISNLGLKNIKSNKIVKGPQKVKSSITANRNRSKSSKSRLPSANRKRENKKK